ncbi:MAG: hypothetical protein HRU76_04880 [Phycisphaeraceae bacterium]|nr:hypothetical protein [Phycisphaerales bacterium]QOJ16957.1 MAG: hypothetical protein HRU76_04880 [Phycisphaeraceae bacterium]
MVRSHDPSSGEWTLRPVTAVFINEYDRLCPKTALRRLLSHSPPSIE